MSNAIQELLREPRPSLFLDMGQGSREQSLPVGDDPSAARCDAPASVALAADSLPAGNVVVTENMRRVRTAVTVADLEVQRVQGPRWFEAAAG